MNHSGVPSDRRCGRRTTADVCLAECKSGSSSSGTKPQFHLGFRHVFRCATKNLGIDSIKLRPNIVSISAPALVREWKELADFFAFTLAHPGHRPEVRFRQRILTNSAYRTVLSWCCCRTGGFLRRAQRVVATFLQLKRAFPPLPEELKESALSKHKTILGQECRPFDWYDIVDDIIQEHFPHGWDRQYKFSGRDIPTLKNRAIYSHGEVSTGPGATARNPSGDVDEQYPRLDPRSSAWPLLAKGAEDQYDRFYREALHPSFDLSVKAVPVPDAGKFRVITKGPRELKVLEPLQKALHKHLVANPIFEFAGKSLRQGDLVPLLERALQAPGAKHRKFLSVDYTSATDSVDGSFMPSLIERIIDRADSPQLRSLSRLAVRELSIDRDIHYPDGSSIRQKRGSLMGSLLSFPLLCYWNESILRRTSSSPSEMRINGDDALLHPTRSDSLDWVSGITKLGLTPSKGKVFWSNRLITFCSRYYCIRGKRAYEIPFVPVNLMLCPMDGNLYNLVPDLYKPGYKKWCQFIPNEHRNLVGPRSLGGLGGHIGPTGLSPKDRNILSQHNRHFNAKHVPLLVARALRFDVKSNIDATASWVRPSKAFVPAEVSYPVFPKRMVAPTGPLRHFDVSRKKDLRDHGGLHVKFRSRFVPAFLPGLVR